VGVDDQYMITVNDDRRVAIQHGGGFGDRAKDAGCDLLEVEQFGPGKASSGSLTIAFDRPNR
jgi:hypothetical protein